ncbi:MAG: YdjY domain-containing protein [Planctomycetota bacterium]|nr:YdjY domain-containing protein [Planctomycetota bacterium]
MNRSLVIATALVSLAGCAARPRSEAPSAPTPTLQATPDSRATDRPAELRWVELSPGLRVQRESRTLELDGFVPIDATNPDTPRIFLEVVVCTPNTREHEALVMTRVKPSAVHAALLALGLEPGAPGAIRVERGEIRAVDPTGPELDVTIITPDGVEHDAREWVVHFKSGESLAKLKPKHRFVFAGSRFVAPKSVTPGPERYDADDEGLLVGLHTFGGETVAFARAMSPETRLEPAEWIADRSRVPAYGTPIRVRIRAVQ